MKLEKQLKTVVIDAVKLTNRIRLEKFAVLDDDVNLIDGELPDSKKGGYGIYYRVIQSHESGETVIIDYSGDGLKPLDETLPFFAKWSKK